jgi:hypothetical protein
VRNVGYRFTIADSSDEVKEEEQSRSQSKKSL